LRKDLTAAVRDPWSQGPTEGSNHQMKRLKRLMYGRAKCLLRQLIPHTPCIIKSAPDPSFPPDRRS